MNSCFCIKKNKNGTMIDVCKCISEHTRAENRYTGSMVRCVLIKSSNARDYYT